MNASDGGRPPGDLGPERRAADGAAPHGHGEGSAGGDEEARRREEEAEARLREIGSFTDSMAAFAGPDDEAGHARGDARGRGRRRNERARRDEYYPPAHYDDSSYDGGGTSMLRWALRILVPLVFLGVVVALVLVVVGSGILGGDAAVSPSPSASPSGPAVVGERTYKVKKGDTLSQISERFGVSVDQILEANPKLNLNNLSVGTKITIPAPE